MSGGQLFAVAAQGGYYASFNLSTELRKGVQATQRFRQFADVKDAWNVKRSGETFTWDTVPMMSRNNRSLSETNTMPSGSHAVLQGTLTISERGMSIPYTDKLEKLSMVGVRAPIMRVLKYDAACDLDALCHAQFAATPLRYVGSTSSTGVLETASPCTGVNTSAFNSTHAKNIVDEMKSRNIPPYENGDYYAISRPATFRTFKNNIETLHSYTETGLTMIMNGEIGRYEQMRFIEQTSIPANRQDDETGGWNAYTETAGTAWSGGSDWIYFFGADTVAEAVNTPEEIRAKLVDDYGRSKGLAWYYLGGFGLEQTNATQARIVAWASIS
jgi:hypothetical protein